MQQSCEQLAHERSCTGTLLATALDAGSGGGVAQWEGGRRENGGKRLLPHGFPAPVVPGLSRGLYCSSHAPYPWPAGSIWGYEFADQCGNLSNGEPHMGHVSATGTVLKRTLRITVDTHRKEVGSGAK